MLDRLILLLTLLLAPCVQAGAGQLTDAAWPVMQRLNAALVRYQCTDPGDSDYGGILCPGCGLYHTRAAEAVFPLAFEYSQTGNRQRKEQALILADWLMRQQKADGSWEETPETWTGTTTDQLLMLLLSYPILEKKLSRADRKRWLECMERAADYLIGFMDNRHASINYCATTTATLSEAWLRFDKAEYLSKARSLAHMVVAKMNPEWFVEGEGGREGDYRYGVDIGYNLEMSLWGLARYALNAGDSLVLEAVRHSTANHLAFIYPDGMLDNSAGTRSNKWTVYGSGTSDGCHPLFAQMSGGHPEYITAAVRNISLMEGCFTRCGLLGQGPDYDAVRDLPPCIYPTFTKAKSLAMAMSWVAADVAELAPLPNDADRCVFFQTLGMAVVRKGVFCSTVTAYGYQSKDGVASKNMFRPAGGAMSALWVEGFGLLQASSQTEYHRWEPMSFPEMGDVKPLTPRLETVDGDRYYTNLFDFSATASMDTLSSPGAVRWISTGALRDRERAWGGVMFRIDYVWTSKNLTKRYEVLHQTCSGPVRVVEPLVFDEGLTVLQTDSHTVELSRNDRVVVIQCPDHAIKVEENAAPSHRQVYPSLRALPLVIESPAGFGVRDTVTIRYSLR